MTVPLVVLAAGALLVGYLGVPEGLSGGKIPNYFEHFLKPSIAESNAQHTEVASNTRTDRSLQTEAPHQGPATGAEDHSLELTLTGVSIVIALAGIGIGWLWFKRKPLWNPPGLLEDKYYVDELYDAVVNDRPVRHNGRWGKATLEACLAIQQSARERREIILSHQVPTGD